MLERMQSKDPRLPSGDFDARTLRKGRFCVKVRENLAWEVYLFQSLTKKQAPTSLSVSKSRSGISSKRVKVSWRDQARQAGIPVEAQSGRPGKALARDIFASLTKMI